MEQATDTPKYYYREYDNKVIKIHGDKGVYFQIKAFTEAHIRHSYGKVHSAELIEEIEITNSIQESEHMKFTECKEEKFNAVMFSYYEKEVSNRNTIHNHIMKKAS